MKLQWVYYLWRAATISPKHHTCVSESFQHLKQLKLSQLLTHKQKGWWWDAWFVISCFFQAELHPAPSPVVKNKWSNIWKNSWKAPEQMLLVSLWFGSNSAVVLKKEERGCPPIFTYLYSWVRLVSSLADSVLFNRAELCECCQCL